MKRNILIAVVLVILAFVVIANIFKSSAPTKSNVVPTPLPTFPTSPPPLTPLVEPNIQVTSPQSNQKLKFPYTIAGKARVFENSLNYRVKDEMGRVLTEGILTTNSKNVGLFGDFSTEVRVHSVPTNSKGFIEVFSLSAKDGSETNMVRIPIVFEN